MYADDTICITSDTQTMNKFVAKFEAIGGIYGLKLNKNKFELLTTEKDPNIHFQNKQNIKNTINDKMPRMRNKQSRRQQTNKPKDSNRNDNT